MVLLEALTSNEDSVVRGKIEDGDEVILPVPHPQSVCGVGIADEAMAKLKERARHDTGQYYLINDTPVREEGAYSIAYITFKI